MYYCLEFSRQPRQIHVKGAESSSDSLFLQSVSSDAESEKASLSHRRTSSDLSHESRGRKRFSNFSAVRFMGNRYNGRLGATRKCKIIIHISLSYLRKRLKSKN